MPVLKRVSDAFWDYVSPRKHRRAPPRSSVPLETPSRHAGRDTLIIKKEPLSPAKITTHGSRIYNWKTSTQSSSVGEKRKRIDLPEIDEDDGRAHKILKSTEPLSDDLDGTTLIDPDTGDCSSDDVIVVRERSADSEYDSDDELDDTLLEPEETEIETRTTPLDVIAEGVQKPSDSVYISRAQLLTNGWPADSITLIQKLHQRGYEPLLPAHWQMDFKFLPNELFSNSTELSQAPFINSISGRDFHATKALDRLLQLGPKIRDKVTCRKRPDPLVKKELREYMRWARADASISRAQQELIIIENGDADSDINAMEHALLSRLLDLHTRLQDTAPAGQEVPTLYGVLISHTLVGVVSFRPPWHTEPDAPVTPSKRWGRATTPGERGSLRSVGVFDFGHQDYDVWNSLALALLVLHCRNVGVEMRDSWARGAGASDHKI
ncbi:hypothetical protein MBLNU459_g1901t1 [Dothideomycetes sp. NU459]